MNDYDEVRRRLAEAEAHFQQTHRAAEGTPVKSHERAERDRAESAVKSLRMDAFLVGAAAFERGSSAVERAAQSATRPIYLQPSGLSDRVTDVYPEPPF